MCGFLLALITGKTLTGLYLYFDKNYVIAGILMRSHYTKMILSIMTTSNKARNIFWNDSITIKNVA
jgi:hypothetical protein